MNLSPMDLRFKIAFTVPNLAENGSPLEFSFTIDAPDEETAAYRLRQAFIEMDLQIVERFPRLNG